MTCTAGGYSCGSLEADDRLTRPLAELHLPRDCAQALG